MSSTRRFGSWRRRLLLTDAAGYRVKLLALLAGQIVSWTGNRVYQVALPLFIIGQYGVGVSLGIMLAVRLVPTILLGPWAGILTDRLQCRAVIAYANVASAALVLLIPFTSSLPHLYLVSALLGAVDALARPARFALLPEVFPREQLLRVNTAQEVLDAASTIAGPGLAIALMGAFGVGGAFAADALSFLVVVLTLPLLKPLPPTERGTDSGAGGADGRTPFGDVWRLLRGNPSLLILLGVNAAYSVGVATLVVLYAPLALRSLDAGEWGYGVLLTATGVGALLGAVLTPRLRSKYTPRVVLGLLGYSGALLVAIGFLDHLWIIVVLLGLALVPESSIYLVFSTRSQQEVPGGMVGRYFGVVSTVLSVLLPVGNSLGGVLASSIGARQGVALVGLGFAAAAAAGSAWVRLSARAPARML